MNNFMKAEEENKILQVKRGDAVTLADDNPTTSILVDNSNVAPFQTDFKKYDMKVSFFLLPAKLLYNVVYKIYCYSIFVSVRLSDSLISMLSFSFLDVSIKLFLVAKLLYENKCMSVRFRGKHFILGP